MSLVCEDKNLIRGPLLLVRALSWTRRKEGAHGGLKASKAAGEEVASVGVVAVSSDQPCVKARPTLGGRVMVEGKEGREKEEEEEEEEEELRISREEAQN